MDYMKYLKALLFRFVDWYRIYLHPIVVAIFCL